MYLDEMGCLYGKRNLVALMYSLYEVLNDSPFQVYFLRASLMCVDLLV